MAGAGRGDKVGAGGTREVGRDPAPLTGIGCVSQSGLGLRVRLPCLPQEKGSECLTGSPAPHTDLWSPIPLGQPLPLAPYTDLWSPSHPDDCHPQPPTLTSGPPVPQPPRTTTASPYLFCREVWPCNWVLSYDSKKL